MSSTIQILCNLLSVAICLLETVSMLAWNHALDFTQNSLIRWQCPEKKKKRKSKKVNVSVKRSLFPVCRYLIGKTLWDWRALFSPIECPSSLFFKYIIATIEYHIYQIYHSYHCPLSLILNTVSSLTFKRLPHFQAAIHWLIGPIVLSFLYRSFICHGQLVGGMYLSVSWFPDCWFSDGGYKGDNWKVLV